MVFCQRGQPSIRKYCLYRRWGSNLLHGNQGSFVFFIFDPACSLINIAILLTNQEMTSKKLLTGIFGILIFSAGNAQFQQLPNTQVHQLEELAQEFQQKDVQLQNRIKAYAESRGLSIHQVLPDGKVISLFDFEPDGKPVYIQTDNVRAAATIATSKVHPSATLASRYNLAGRGFRIGEWDGGANRITHREYQGRAIQADNSTMAQSEHATHVGGTLIAGGVTPNAKGMAYQAGLLANDWNNDATEMASRASQGLILSNHSYGAVCGWSVDASGNWAWNGNDNINPTYDYKFGYYDSRARDWDRLAFNAPHYLIVKSAGNARNEGPANDPTHPRNGPYDCLPTYSTAKNILTVGAVNGLSNGYNGPASVTMSDFSSWGPADDGRIKPDIVGCGVNVFSAGSASDNDYVSQSGTSMSGPSVAGSCLLLQELYSNTHNQKTMKSASLKGLVIHTANECFNPAQGGWTGPDYRFGWGLMNTRKAADLILDDQIRSLILEDTLQNQQPVEMEVVAKGGTPLVATLCWTDYQGTPGAAAYNDRTPKLVNDLDIRLFTAAGQDTTFPWRLNPDSLTSPARKGDNKVDNVEKIELSLPIAGQTYKIRIRNKGNLFTGAGQPQRQPYSLIVSGIVAGDTNFTCLPRQFMNAKNGILDDGSGSGKNYASNADCGWVLNPEDSNSVVQLIFRNFNVATGDTLFVYSGTNAGGELIGKFSGSSLPDTLLSNSAQMFLNFKSDASSQTAGWEVAYKSVQKPNFDFFPASTTLCEGDPVNFNVQVINGPSTDWNFAWNLPGSSNPNPSGSSATVSYSQAGTYDVSLTVSNEAGPKTIIKPSLMTIKPGIAQNQGPFSEGFESSSFPNNSSNPALSWTTTADANPWQRSSLSPYEGLASARIKNFTNLSNVRVLTSPSFDLSGNNVQKFVKFRYAYARLTTAASSDQLRVLASSDCGRTWIELLKRNNTSTPKLSTIGDTPSDVVVGTFIPEPAQYRLDSLSLSSLPGSGNNISVRFEMTSEKGNFLYLDNVVIGGITTGFNDISLEGKGISIAPNPGDGNAVLQLSRLGAQVLGVELLDLQGKVLSSSKIEVSGNTRMTMNEAFGPQKTGIYLIRVKSASGIQSLKWANN